MGQSKTKIPLPNYPKSQLSREKQLQAWLHMVVASRKWLVVMEQGGRKWKEKERRRRHGEGGRGRRVFAFCREGTGVFFMGR